MSDILIHNDNIIVHQCSPPAETFDIVMNGHEFWFDDVPLFPPQAVVGVISGVLNSKNVPAFRANSKSPVRLYSISIYKKYSCSILCILICTYSC